MQKDFSQFFSETQKKIGKKLDFSQLKQEEISK